MPHNINGQIGYGYMVVRSSLKLRNNLHIQGTDVDLLNTDMVSVSCKYHFCRRKISSSLDGNSKILGLVETNNNSKNYIYQIIDG